MGFKVVPTESFKHEYDSILHYLIEILDAPSSASQLVKAVEKMRIALEDNPKCRPISQKPILNRVELREYLAKNYVVVYRIENASVYLEHMFHQKQDFEKLID